MLRSSMVEGERFNADDGPYADLALWLRVASRSDVGFLAAALSGYLVHQSSASSGFEIVRVKGERHQMTFHHADAILQAHGRFVQRPDLDENLGRQLRAILVDADRRMRLTIRAKAVVPPSTLAVLKQAAHWRRGSLMHRLLAVDADVSAPSGVPAGPEVVALPDASPRTEASAVVTLPADTDVDADVDAGPGSGSASSSRSAR